MSTVLTLGCGQELLAHLLDGIHEDCNRVLRKPPTEVVEADETASEVETAAESWRRHLLRNRSFIVDAFQGQYKSRVECPDCRKVSITFDPFMYLSGRERKYWRSRHPLTCS